MISLNLTDREAMVLYLRFDKLIDVDASEETDQEIDNIYSKLRKEVEKNGEHA